jgi:hypothetical protein
MVSDYSFQQRRPRLLRQKKSGAHGIAAVRISP